MLSSTPSDLERSVPESERHSTASGAEMLAQNVDPTVPSTTKARLHLPYLDGIRALMALYVVHNHLLSSVGFSHNQFGIKPGELIQMFYQGHYAVAVFIVISGYCLMLPVLRENGTLRGGLGTFFKRRARRILPPYYAALVCAGVLYALFALITNTPASELTSLKRWALHAVLLHNLSSNHIYDYNGAMWSIATEWQIYFLFPFIFLPVWKRLGEAALFVVGCVLAAAVTILFPSIAKACPWFIALFAFGMIAARWSLQPATWMRRIPWVWLGILITVATYLGVRIIPAFSWFEVHNSGAKMRWYPFSDIAVGCATFCFLMHGTRASIENRRSKFLSILTWRPLVFIGAFSYSLYLIHMPVQSVSTKLFGYLNPSRPQIYGMMLLTYFPLIIATAYVFYLLFEKPFLGAPKPKNTAVKPTSS